MDGGNALLADQEYSPINLRALRAERDRQIAAEYASGAPLDKISQKYGVSIASIRVIASILGARRKGVPPPKRVPPLKIAARNAAVVTAYDSGKSLETVAAEFGITRERVRQILVSLGHYDRHGGYNEPEQVAFRAREAQRIAKREAKRRAREERDAKICALYQEGKTYKEIAEAIGRTETYISLIQKVVADAGIMNRSPRTIGRVRCLLTEADKDAVAARYAAGENTQLIAAEFGIAPGYVARVAWLRGARRPKVLGQSYPLPDIRPSNRSPWSPDELARLSECLARGMSGSEIGKELGRSRSAVFGKICRLRQRAHKAAP